MSQGGAIVVIGHFESRLMALSGRQMIEQVGRSRRCWNQIALEGCLFDLLDQNYNTCT
jgi:hypothetical protein